MWNTRLNNLTKEKSVYDRLDFIYKQVYLYCSIFIIIFGVVGNVFNIILFSRRALYPNSCSFYFLTLSINNLIIMFFSCIPDIFIITYGIDMKNNSTILCKIGWYYSFTVQNFSLFCLSLASFDRYCGSSSNAHMRRFCTMKTAQRIVLVLAMFVLFSYCHVPIFYQLDPTLNQCTIINATYRQFLSILSGIYISHLPVFLMLVFGISTIFNVKKSRLRLILVQPEVLIASATAPTHTLDNVIRIPDRVAHAAMSPQNVVSQRTHNDQQLLQMLICHVLTYIGLTIFPTVIYYIMTFSPITEIILFFFYISRLPYYVVFAISFYVYVLSLRVYRKEFSKLFIELRQSLHFN
ncbi:unnamed protein product [Adineta ricciae]|uniref:G-protein coupled receptors family 1 profile domain-containing protein n=1 Tax=Adineta ricciae TaxID=249248 RepID=A0A815IA37_ADIRI|nr:unnamed protein product [Adineta ricciae]CAF1508281.1 unnamed protein product [Adineta ricciae]